MLSKSLLRILMISLLFVACTQESIERHQQRTNEDNVEVVGGEITPSNQASNVSSQYGPDHKRIDDLIEKGDAESLSQALMGLDQQLFSSVAEDPVMYTSAMYVGYLNLYVKLFKVWEGQQELQPFAAEYTLSMDKFYGWFIASCVYKGVSNCEKLKESLMKAKSAVAIINYFIQKTESPEEKLALAGLAYDLSGSREEATLNTLYINALLNVFGQADSEPSNLSNDEARRHTINLVALFNSYNWSENKPQLSNLFKKVKPWELKQPAVSSLDILRGELVQFVPVYAQRDEAVMNSLKEYVVGQIDGIQEGNFDLSKYPAYDNIDLNSLKNEDPLVVYLLLGIYYQTIEVTNASLFLSKMSHTGAAAEKIYELSKTLIRWDVAQLSIDSTKKLAAKFQEQETKTKTFVEEVLDYSKQLVPEWTSIHSVRLYSIRRFVNSTIPQMVSKTGPEVREFYSSINRNILKTTVYPNMLAFMYHMAKTEWQAQIRIWFWTFDLDTTDIFDFMMTGNYYYPWFNFTNLAEDAGYNDDTRVSLYRSEIMDSFYYLLATKTAEEYSVDVDDMIKVVSDTVLRKRVRPFRDV
ncbi:MAG: hypothetical protein HRT44_06450, partial [Bdellovibrionales bacterium]|nr:hypothetical protein [Bdellovibrionales bacterium]